jgi:hypothetical protein
MSGAETIRIPLAHLDPGAAIGDVVTVAAAGGTLPAEGKYRIVRLHEHTAEGVLLDPGKVDYQGLLSPDAAAWLVLHPDEWDCLTRFSCLMIEELAANNGKGNRPGWLQMDRKEAIGEVHWHASKLAVAAKDFEDGPHPDARYTREFAADVANCALMVLDCMGLLRASSKEVGGDGE